MACNLGYLNYVLDLLSCCGNITHRALFGGYGIYNDGKILAIIADDELYFKVNDSNKQDFVDSDSEPFTYYKNNKPYSLSYWKVPAEILEVPELLQTWFNKAYMVALLKK